MAAKRLYEGMFLVDSALATADWEGTLAFVENILKRADAEVVVIRKWGERKLAYDIEHKSRGTYILAYFKADGRRIAGIEKDVLLSEKIMRVLILGRREAAAETDRGGYQGSAPGEPEDVRAGRDPSRAASGATWSWPMTRVRRLEPERRGRPRGRRR